MFSEKSTYFGSFSLNEREIYYGFIENQKQMGWGIHLKFSKEIDYKIDSFEFPKLSWEIKNFTNME